MNNFSILISFSGFNKKLSKIVKLENMKIAPLFRFISSTAVKMHDDYTLEIIGPKFSGIIASSSNVLPSDKGDLYLWANRLLLDQ